MSGRLVAIDGKTCRGSKDPAKGLGALHVVSAWASEEGIALGQVATDEKSNEITAIPLLLDQIGLPGTLVTIDAMGCQKEIVEKIVAGGGDFVIAVKDNQPKLLEAVRKALFDDLEREREDLRYRVHETIEAGHGRIDERSYLLTKTPRDFAAAAEWPWIKAVGYAVRITRRPDGTESDEVRYYISTRYVGPKRFAEAVRGHWSIESMHWVLDVRLPRGRPPHPRTHPGRQPELAPPLRRDPPETPSRQRQHPRQDARLRIQHRLSDASLEHQIASICGSSP